MAWEGSNYKFNNLGAQYYPLKPLGVQCECRVGIHPFLVRGLQHLVELLYETHLWPGCTFT